MGVTSEPVASRAPRVACRRETGFASNPRLGHEPRPQERCEVRGRQEMPAARPGTPSALPGHPVGPGPTVQKAP